MSLELPTTGTIHHAPGLARQLVMPETSDVREHFHSKDEICPASGVNN
jgi:hypothetical protein